jgi:hypothetical protein
MVVAGYFFVHVFCVAYAGRCGAQCLIRALVLILSPNLPSYFMHWAAAFLVRRLFSAVTNPGVAPDLLPRLHGLSKGVI